MSVKSLIWFTDQQDASRALVESGRYTSLSAVLQQALELPRRKTEADTAETGALRRLIAARSEGGPPFRAGDGIADRPRDRAQAAQSRCGKVDYAVRAERDFELIFVQTSRSARPARRRWIAQRTGSQACASRSTVWAELRSSGHLGRTFVPACSSSDAAKRRSGLSRPQNSRRSACWPCFSEPGITSDTC